MGAELEEGVIVIQGYKLEPLRNGRADIILVAVHPWRNAVSYDRLPEWFPVL